MIAAACFVAWILVGFLVAHRIDRPFAIELAEDVVDSSLTAAGALLVLACWPWHLGLELVRRWQR